MDKVEKLRKEVEGLLTEAEQRWHDVLAAKRLANVAERKYRDAVKRWWALVCEEGRGALDALEAHEDVAVRVAHPPTHQEGA